jgi:hypothetical protein
MRVVDLRAVVSKHLASAVLVIDNRYAKRVVLIVLVYACCVLLCFVVAYCSEQSLCVVAVLHR